MTRTVNLIVTRASICCAAVLATALLAGPASAMQDYLVHSWGDQNICFNNPYNSGNNGNQLWVTPHCDNNDTASDVIFDNHDGPLVLKFETSKLLDPVKCMDNLYGVQQEFNPIVVWECNGGETQKWDYVDGVFHYHPNPAMCASVAISANPADYAGSGSLVLAHCNGQGNQKFVLTEIPSFDFSNFGGNPHAACGHKICGTGGCYCIDD